MAKHLLDEPIPPSGLPLEGGIILFPYDPKFDSDYHPRTVEEILRHRYQIPGVPYGYQIDPDGFLADVMRCMPATRRQFAVHQLQKLDTHYAHKDAPRLPGPHIFKHVRGTHALDCAVAVAIICNTHGIIGPLALQMILAEFCHDSATPAFGDIIFVLSRKEISEDVELPRLFTEFEPEGFSRLCTKWSLPKNTADIVVATANGIGVGGEVHKLIDARSYALRDLASLCNFYQRHNQDLPAVFGETLCCAAQEPFDILHTTKLENGHGYCSDPKRLALFLKIRLELWRRLYTNPYCKTTELFYREVVLRALLAETGMRLRDFLRLDDHQVQQAIREKIGFFDNGHVNRRGCWPTISFFSNWTEARNAEEQLFHSGNVGILCSQLNDQKPDAKTKRHLVKNAEGNLVSFKEACPKESAEIEDLAVPLNLPFQLIAYPLRRDELSSPVLRAYYAARVRWEKEPELYPDHL